MSTPTWTELSPSFSPSARVGHSMDYDPIRNKTVLYGGWTSNSPPGNFASWDNNTYEWDGTDWSLIPGGDNLPSGVGSSIGVYSMAWDGTTDKMMIFLSGSGSCEVWLYDGTSWTQTFPTHLPTAIDAFGSTPASSSICYHPGTGKTYLYNHETTFSWDGTDWTNLSVAVPSDADAHDPSIMSYNPDIGEIVWLSTSKNLYTYTFDGTNWTYASGISGGVNNFSNFALAAQLSVYSATCGGTVTYCGPYPNDGHTSRTIVFNNPANTWTDLAASPDPGQRSEFAMSKDPTGLVLLFGGTTYSTDVGLFGDTWRFECVPPPTPYPLFQNHISLK